MNRIKLVDGGNLSVYIVLKTSNWRYFNCFSIIGLLKDSGIEESERNVRVLEDRLLSILGKRTLDEAEVQEFIGLPYNWQSTSMAELRKVSAEINDSLERVIEEVRHIIALDTDAVSRTFIDEMNSME